MYACLECGKKFKTTAAAERAVNNGCPKCGGSDIDLDVAAPVAGAKPVKKYADDYPESEIAAATEAGYDKLAGGWIGNEN